MREEVPDHECLEEETVKATGTCAERVLELGTGTGETARRLLARHPLALLVGLDASSEMLRHAAATLPADRVQLRVARLEDPLPPGPFDVVVSALTVHHLDANAKAQLFQRVAGNLKPSERLVIGDVFVPADPSDAVTSIDCDFDTPDSVVDQLSWLADAGPRPAIARARRDLAVIVGEAPGAACSPPRRVLRTGRSGVSGCLGRSPALRDSA